MICCLGQSLTKNELGLGREHVDIFMGVHGDVGVSLIARYSFPAHMAAFFSILCALFDLHMADN